MRIHLVAAAAPSPCVDAVMATSAILRHGIGGMTTLRDGLQRWMEEREFASVAEMRGVMELAAQPGP